jgi:hypothetical protein
MASNAPPHRLVSDVNRVAIPALGAGGVVRDAIRTGALRDSTLDPVALFGGLPDTIGRRPAWLTKTWESSETDLILGCTDSQLVICSGSQWSVNALVATIPLSQVRDVEYETRRMPWGRQTLLGLRFSDGTTIALAIRPVRRAAARRFLTTAFDGTW